MRAIAIRITKNGRAPKALTFSFPFTKILLLSFASTDGVTSAGFGAPTGRGR
jgi:hypothetical protein